MRIRRFAVPVTVDAAGDATVYSPRIFGRLISFAYVKTDYADGVGFTITAETTGETLWTEAAVNASAVRHPRAATCSTAGVASLYVAAGTAVLSKIGLGGDRIKIVVAAGGVSKTGVFHITVDG